MRKGRARDRAAFSLLTVDSLRPPAGAFCRKPSKKPRKKCSECKRKLRGLLPRRRRTDGEALSALFLLLQANVLFLGQQSCWSASTTIAAAETGAQAEVETFV